MNQLPEHLKKYVVEQNYEKYTPIDQAVWRFILRQLKSFLSIHAHESYVSGLEKTGIDIETIPKISEISKKLEAFGWRALPVSGFIPPAAFMELQSLSILPIASDIRAIEHIEYTPAPDIVHEAAGHAPIIAHPEFAAYLKEYSQVAKKSIISQEDMNLYEAIRVLSDLKENPKSTAIEIKNAEDHLSQVSKSMSHISEASELSRMNWWTAEYGLIGDIQHPKILGAGLLSSVGEAKWCLNSKVKKIPLSIDCLKTTYDITEPQPQLYVTPDFKTLSKVLEDMACNMAFRKGGAEGLNKAIKAQTVNTFELNSGIQISGKISKFKEKNGKVIFINTVGPTQICYEDKQLSGHNKEYHQHGYSTPIGNVTKVNGHLLQMSRDLSSASISELEHWGISQGKEIILIYDSEVQVQGKLTKILFLKNHPLLLSIEEATVTFKDETLFEPSWGTFDLVLGEYVASVFGGPADRIAYGIIDDFVAARVPAVQYTPEEKVRHQIYQKVRDLRHSKANNQEKQQSLIAMIEEQKSLPPEKNWLLKIELYELSIQYGLKELQNSLHKEISACIEKAPQFKDIIEEGIRLANA